MRPFWNFLKVKVAGTLELSGRHLSVDAPFQDGEENSLLDVLPSHDTPSTDSKLIEESLAKEIERTLSTLPEKESNVIRAFYGIGTKPMSLGGNRPNHRNFTGTYTPDQGKGNKTPETKIEE